MISPAFGGALLVLAVAVVLFTSFGVKGQLTRDESIYAYAGQQLAHGIPPYASIFDPKGPLASMIAGVSAAAAHLVGVNDLTAIRAVFCLLACLTVVAVYVLALQLWGSALGAVAAGVVFAAFRGFAADALGGPDAKTPGILFLVVSLVLVLRGRWFWGSFAAALAFLVWQPLAIYLVVAIGAGVWNARGRRRLALLLGAAGAAVPIVGTVVYFAVVGALGDFAQAAFVFPVTTADRGGVLHNVGRVVTVVHRAYQFSGVLFWVGSVLLVALCVHRVRRVDDGGWRSVLHDPLISVVLSGFVMIVLFSINDFQGPPDLYPLLPYPALGIAGVVALAVDRSVASAVRLRVVTAVVLAGAAAVTGMSWAWFVNAPDKGKLIAQRTDACALQRILGTDRSLYVLGDPAVLVLTGRRSSYRMPYLSGGVDTWRIDHTRDGLAGWIAQIRSARPDVIVRHSWHDEIQQDLTRWIRQHYRGSYLGVWHLYTSHHAYAHARHEGIRLTRHRTPVATGLGGRALPSTCSRGSHARG